MELPALASQLWQMHSDANWNRSFISTLQTSLPMKASGHWTKMSAIDGDKRFFDGFHRSIPAFASVGIDLLIEHIVEEQSWADDLKTLLAPFDAFWVGVHAPIEEIERRERLRGNRHIGEGSYHLKTHRFCRYHVEVDTTQQIELNVTKIIDAWKEWNQAREQQRPNDFPNRQPTRRS